MLFYISTKQSKVAFCCLIGLMSYFLPMIAIMSFANAAEPLTPGRRGLVVLKLGRFVYVRSAISDREDVVIPITAGPSNGQIIFGMTFLVPSGTPMDAAKMHEAKWEFHACFDDAVPWCLNETYIGANHGANDVMKVTSPSHGLSDSDLGSLWKDAAGTAFYVVGTAGGDHVLLLSENMGEYPRWKFTRSIEGKKLTNTATGRILPIHSAELSQLLPACRIKSQRFVVDGKLPLEEGVPAQCTSFEVAEESDIIAPDSVLEAFKQSAGQRIDFVSKEREAVLSNHIVYQFQPGGACVIRHHATALRDFDLSYMGFIQSAPLYTTKNGCLLSYIPKTLPFRADGMKYDFGGVQDLSVAPTGPLIFSLENGNVADASDLPDRFIQILRDGGRQVGFAMGYSLVHELTKPAVRAANTGSPLFIFTTKKTYPAAIDRKAGPVKKGTVMECLAYRQYFDPQSHPGATCVYGNMQEGDYILYADFHRKVEKITLKVPDIFKGRRFDVVEKTDSIEIASHGEVADDGIPVVAEGERGSVILRVSGDLR